MAWRQQGRIDLRRPAPPTRHTRFRWYSVSKLVTATVAARLAERGAVELDRPLALARGATLRALLSHRSGLPNPSALRWVHAEGAAVRSPARLTAELMQRARRGRAVTRYSNLNYLLVAEHLEQATGTPFVAHVAQLCDALGLRETTFDPSPAAVGHERSWPRGAAMLGLFFPRSLSLIAYTRGGWIGLEPLQLEGLAYGGLVGSLRDLVRFGRLHLGEGTLDGERVLSDETLRAMRPAQDAPAGQYGLGFESLGGGWIGHHGQAGGYRASLRVHPVRGVGHASLAAWGDAPLG